METFKVGLNAFLFYHMVASCGVKGVECGGWDENGPHKSIGSGIRRRCGLVVRNVSCYRVDSEVLDP